jgi:hypothetical protein
MPTFRRKVTGPDNAIEGEAVDGRGVVGKSVTNYGMRAHSAKSAGIRASSDEGRGVEGWATKSEGVVGITKTTTGVWGQTDSGIGVVGSSVSGDGVLGESQRRSGVRGASRDGRGVEGWSTSAYGVSGDSKTSAGVRGTSVAGRGVEGWSETSEGLFGISKSGSGVVGTSESGDGAQARTGSSSKNGIFALNDSSAPCPQGIPGGNGVFAVSHVPNASAVFGVHNSGGLGVLGHSDQGVGIQGSGKLAGRFFGDVEVTGDIRLPNADCAEDFEVAGAASAEPGTVMVLAGEGALIESRAPYDKRVAGVISGAGDYRPAIVLDSQKERADRKPIALLGKVFCKVDASFGAIEVGDLLTSSAVPGHAMKAQDAAKAFGAVIGKALRSLKEGQGLIPVLISLQ